MPQPDLIQNLFRSNWPSPRAAFQTVQKGSLIMFHYTGQSHGYQIQDFYPLIIVSDAQGYIDQKTGMPHADIIRGVNLHYLTLPSVKELVYKYTTPDFSYAAIKGRIDWAGAFRSYKRAGIDYSTLKMLDVEFLKNLLKAVRALDVNEIEQIRAQIQQMIQNPEIVQAPAVPGPEIGR